MLKPGRCRGGEQGLFGAAEKVKALEVAAFDGPGLGETVEHPDARREVVQTGEVFEIAAVATKQDLTEVVEAVDGLSDGGEGTGCRALPMFHLAVVLESGDVVGGGLDAQDEAEFVVNLNRGFAETMLDAGALDPGCSARDRCAAIKMTPSAGSRPASVRSTVSPAGVAVTDRTSASA